MNTSTEVAKLIINLCDERDISLTNLKLQKLMYYSQAYHLAVSDSVLFDDKVMAWEHGPVVASVWREYNFYGSGVISSLPSVSADSFSSVSLEVVNYVLDTVGHIGAWALVRKTHAEDPWLSHYNRDTGQPDKTEITPEEISVYFKSVLASKQDKNFASIMDDMYSEPVAVPEGIQSAKEFSKWMDSL